LNKMSTSIATEETPAQTRQLDAENIEELLTKHSSEMRASARIHLEQLIAKLKREAAAMERALQSAAKAASDETVSENNKPGTDQVGDSSTEASQAPVPAATSNKATTNTHLQYIPINTFGFDAGSYNSAFVTLYISVNNIVSDKVTCDFTKESFDLKICDDSGKWHRLYRDNLEKEIDPEKCKFKVKSDKVVIKLGKVKGEFGFDNWNNLTEKKKKQDSMKNKDPSASIMDLMKDMYDNGDDQMKKMIGETMMKQQRGELGKDMDDQVKGLGDM